MKREVISLQSVTKRYGNVVAVDNINLDILRGEFLTLLGPSGSGKSTILKLIAGFEEPTSGKILIDGVDAFTIPIHKRPVNMVFQNYALFPHMNVFDNIAFGLKMMKKPKDYIRKKVKEALELIGLEGYEKRMVYQLSGGEQQRIALARALVTDPSVLLLDEPLGSLDLKLRKRMQLELKDIHRKMGITFLYVTHDQEEAMVMSDRIAVMSKGRIIQLGTPSEIYERPMTRFVADFIGEANILEGTVVAGESGKMLIEIMDGVRISCENNIGASSGDRVYIALRPEDITVSSREDDKSRIVGEIYNVIYVGSDVICYIRSGSTLLKAKLPKREYEENKLEENTRVFIAWDDSRCKVMRE